MVETAMYVVSGKLRAWCNEACEDVRTFINVADCGAFLAADCEECGTTKLFKKRTVTR